MTDKNFRYIYLKKFPKETINLLKELYDIEIKEDAENLDETYPYPNKDNWKAFSYRLDKRDLKKNISTIELNGLTFYITYFITNKNAGLVGVHVDRGRNYAFNVPIIVDLEKSHTLVVDEESAKLNNFEKLGKTSTWTNDYGLTSTIWPEAKEDDFDKITFDYPMILQADIPHAWTNHANELRVIATLTLIDDENYTLDQILEKMKPYV